MLRLLFATAFFLPACSCGEGPTGDDGTSDAAPDGGGDAGDAGPTCPPDLHVDDDAFVPPDCADGPSPGETDRLAQALELAGTTRDDFGWSADDWSETGYLPVLFDELVLDEFRPNHDEPIRSACWAATTTGEIDHALGAPHLLSRLVSRAATHLDLPVDEAEPTWDYACEGAPLVAPLHALTVALGGSIQQEAVAASVAGMPLDLQVALAPVVLALTEAANARAELWTLAGEDSASQLGGALSGILYLSSAGFAFTDSSGDDSPAILELKEERYRMLYQAAWDLAVALDHARPALLAAAGATGFLVDLQTPGGRILIHDGADDVYDWKDADRQGIALLVDAGGNDRYLVPVGGVNELDQPVALGIDLGGTDFYGYVEEDDPQGDVGHRIPMDLYGRYRGDANYGPFSLSEVNRQGSARFGIGILEDLGGSADEYRTLRMGQGFAAVGVGILHDDGGDDTYVAESGAQGSAMFGIGMLVDEGGADTYTSYAHSQGFGYTKGAAWLVDGGDGADAYVCDHGIPEEGGDPMYYSPQRPHTGNSSMCQAAGDGLRGDSIGSGVWWSGGLGILRDQDGDDSYEASVFAQGTAYWSGIGLLADGGGNDQYEAIWYVQAGAAHYATAILVDAGDGDDVFNDNEWTVGVGVGSGHDYSLGMLLNEGGNDRYFASANGAATGNCNGIGVFVDNGGNDAYRSNTTWSYGHAHVSTECEARHDAITDAVFLDVGGDDTYERTGETLVLDDDVSWLQRGTYAAAPEGYPTEHGVGLDAPDGDSTLHAP